MRGPPLSLGFPGSSNRKGPMERQAASSTQPGACPLPPPTVVWENSRFSGHAPGETLYPDRLLDSVASHCPREGQGGGTSLGGCGGGKAWGTWGGPGRGRKRPQSSHRHGPLPPGSLEHSRGRPPSPAGSTRPPGSPALPFPAQSPLPWLDMPVVWLGPTEVPALRSGKSLAPGHLRPLPLGPLTVSLWPDTHHRGQFTPWCPAVLTDASSEARGEERPLSSTCLIPAREWREGEGSGQGPGGAAPPSPPLRAVPPLC